jgi:hypothetical protein
MQVEGFSMVPTLVFNPEAHMGVPPQAPKCWDTDVRRRATLNLYSGKS